MSEQLSFFEFEACGEPGRRMRVLPRDIGQLEAHCLLSILEVRDAHKSLPAGFMRLALEIMADREPEPKSRLKTSLRKRASGGHSPKTGSDDVATFEVSPKLDGTYYWTYPELIEHTR